MASENHVWQRYTPHKTRKNTRRRGRGTRSPRRRRWSGWRRAGADGHVLVAGRRHGPTRPARTYAAGADPRVQRGPTRPGPAHVNGRLHIFSEKFRISQKVRKIFGLSEIFSDFPKIRSQNSGRFQRDFGARLRITNHASEK